MPLRSSGGLPEQQLELQYSTALTALKVEVRVKASRLLSASNSCSPPILIPPSLSVKTNHITHTPTTHHPPPFIHPPQVTPLLLHLLTYLYLIHYLLSIHSTYLIQRRRRLPTILASSRDHQTTPSILVSTVHQQSLLLCFRINPISTAYKPPWL